MISQNLHRACWDVPANLRPVPDIWGTFQVEGPEGVSTECPLWKLQEQFCWGDGSGCKWMWLVFIVLFQQHHFSPILAFCGWGRAAWTAELRLSQYPKHSSKYSFSVHCLLQNICFLNCYDVLLFNLLVYSASSLAMPRAVFSFSLTNTF